MEQALAASKGWEALGRTAPAVALGVATEEAAQARRFAAAVGAPVLVDVWFQAWSGRRAFDAARAAAAAERGALPVVTWEPWAPGRGARQPRYALRRIADGAHDAVLRRFGRQVAAYAGPVAVRFAHELNASHYPWSLGIGGTAADAVAAWRHVHRVVTAAGAEQVSWVWCVDASGRRPVRPCYPGDDVVDAVAVDGYNAGAALDRGGWRAPEELFGPALDDLAATTDRPVLIGETACTDRGGDRPGWITELFALARAREVRAVVWFEVAKEADWTVGGSPAALAALRRAVAG
jgi:beta-mannanase